jgi:MoxR-like ATPase
MSEELSPETGSGLPRAQVSRIREFRDRIHSEVGRTIVGQEHLVDQLLITILADGHALLEGVPGVAKTLIARTLSSMLGLDFRRIQFTPDLMPADIIGTKVFDFSDSTFKTRKGPIFANVVLIDEVNRSPAKTQSALLEVMEERQVTIEGETFILPEPFLVLATQNPVEFEGTYQLPEAQMDRFLMKIQVDYPSEQEELHVLERFHTGVLRTGRGRTGNVQQPILTGADLKALREVVARVIAEPSILSYINRLVRSTRSHPYLYMGASPRGTISMLLAAKARAALLGRDYVNPDDVKALASPVLRHRIVLNPEAEIEGLTTDTILRDLAAQTEVPK